jgi:hypothetical protein
VVFFGVRCSPSNAVVSTVAALREMRCKDRIPKGSWLQYQPSRPPYGTEPKLPLCRCGEALFNYFFTPWDPATKLPFHSKSTKQSLNF